MILKKDAQLPIWTCHTTKWINRWISTATGHDECKVDKMGPLLMLDYECEVSSHPLIELGNQLNGALTFQSRLERSQPQLS